MANKGTGNKYIASHGLSKHSDTGHHYTNMAHASINSVNFLAENTGGKWPAMIEEDTPTNRGTANGGVWWVS